ncbi:sensor histidine kinase [Kribbella deserti]|uniref:histidine kinase n=1 Tax=Kribbella deserti TaxID=1926257 RepID=A0ABV6QLU9_9ACTN
MPTVWNALGASPWRFLTSSWPWRSYAYLISSVPVATLTLACVAAASAIGVLTAPIIVGLLILGSVPVLGVPIGKVERLRLRLLGRTVPTPHAPMPAGSSLRDRMDHWRRERASLRAFGYGVVLGLFLLPINAAAATISLTLLVVTLISPILAAADQVSLGPWVLDSPAEALPFALIGGPIIFVITSYAVTLLAAAESELAKALLGPREDELRRNIAVLRRSRLDLVDAFETERQRIERHLHDGVQQRLVGLTMTLGLAELDLPEGESRRLVVKAHAEAEAALADLREAVRGIHPRVLVDHGLEAAVREVADRSPLPVTVSLALSERLPAPIEAAAYFVVSEGLANVAKHASARHCEVEGWVRDGRLVVSVTDDGIGAANPAAGTGLTGLVTRLDALGGTLDLSSPPGGPTRLRMECPCRLED